MGEEFQVCLEDFCMTESNSPENEPEYVTLPISDTSEQLSHTSQPPVEVQPSDTSQPPNQEDAGGLLISILLIGVAAVIGIVIKKLTRKKERHGFPDVVKERVLKKQNHRCAHCKRVLNVVDWDHKNGKRYDNGEALHT